MATLKESVQAALRAVTGTAQTYEGDWHAFCDQESIGANNAVSGRILAAAKANDSTIGTASAAENYFLQDPSRLYSTCLTVPPIYAKVSGWWKQGDWIASGGRVSQWNDSLSAGVTAHVEYTGTVSEYASAPDNVAFDIVGDISLIARVAPDDTTPDIASAIIGKWLTTGNRSYSFGVAQGGKLRLRLSADGINEIAKDSTAAPTWTDGAYLWVMATLDVDNGAGGNSIKFYTAADSAALPTSWTQLGSTVTTAGTTSIFSGTSPLYAALSGIRYFDGKIKRALVYSGIVAADGTGGTMVADYDPSSQIDGATSWTSTSPTTEVWTQTATTVTAPKHLLQATGANQPYELPWTGENYVQLFGSGNAGNTCSHPSITAAQITTGNIGIAARIALDDWTPASQQNILAKGVNATTLSYTFRVNSPAGALSLAVTSDGSTLVAAASSAAPSVSDGGWLWVGVFWDNANGQCYFYTAPDSATLPTESAWKQLGTTQALATTTLYDSETTPIVIGRRYVNSTHLSGKIKRVILWTGASTDNKPTGCATMVCDFDASRGTGESNSVSDNTSGQTWDVAAYSYIASNTLVSSPAIKGDGAAYFMRASYTQAQPCTRFFLAKLNGYLDGMAYIDGVGANSAAIYDYGTTPTMAQNAGTAAQNANSAATRSVYHVICALWNGASSKFVVDSTSASGGNPGATTTGGLTIMADGTASPASFADIEFREIIEYNAALSDAEIAQVMAYLSIKGKLA